MGGSATGASNIKKNENKNIKEHKHLLVKILNVLMLLQFTAQNSLSVVTSIFSVATVK